MAQRKRKDQARWLGASRSFDVSTSPDTPFGASALLDEIRTRLVSRGGRPAATGTIRRLVPVKRSVWIHLKSKAQSLSRQGKAVSPAQLAAILIEKSVTKRDHAGSRRSSKASRRSRAS